jgi:hypothetical protein
MRQREVVRKNVLSQERCEALLVSPSEDRIAASETKAGSAHTAHDPALVSPGPTCLHPNKGMHLLVTAAIPPFLGCIETMRPYVTIITHYL